MKAEFKFSEQCIWCNKPNSGVHIFINCNHVDGVLLGNKWPNRLKISQGEWVKDVVNGSDAYVASKTYMMLAIKWGIWRAFSQNRYGNTAIPINVCIDNSFKELKRWLSFIDRYDIWKDIVKLYNM